METIFFHCFRYFSTSPSFRLVGIHFSVQKKKYCFLLITFFPAGRTHYLNHRETYLKLFALPLATIFFNFSDISANASFSLCRRNVFLNKFSVPAGGNRFSVHMKQYSFIWRLFSASGNPIFEK